MSRQERLEMWEEAHRNTVGWLFDVGVLRVVDSGVHAVGIFSDLVDPQ
jgi:hypothetical protein